MGLFGNKKDKFLDLTNYKAKKKKEKKEVKSDSYPQKEGFVDFTQNPAEEIGSQQPEEPTAQDNNGGVAGFFGGFGESQNQERTQASEQNWETESTPDQKRKKLANRLGKMTEQIEDLSNQIYRLQQRVEALEKKSDSGIL